MTLIGALRAGPIPWPMNKPRLTEVFNRAFRCGANDRAARGLALSSETQPPTEIPPSPTEYLSSSDQAAWTRGYTMGYGVGASDAELANVDVPGAHGMISCMSEQMLDMFGVFEGLPDES